MTVHFAFLQSRGGLSILHLSVITCNHLAAELLLTAKASPHIAEENGYTTNDWELFLLQHYQTNLFCCDE